MSVSFGGIGEANEEMKAAGRIPKDVSWKDYHLYGRTLDFENFTHQEMLDYYRENAKDFEFGKTLLLRHAKARSQPKAKSKRLNGAST